MKTEFIVGVHAKAVIDELISVSLARKVTRFVSNNFIVRATRQFPVDHRNSRETIILTWGRPNYAERQFIKDVKKAGKALPSRKLFMSYWPTKKPQRKAA